jgi:hypothetical protein
MRRIAVSPGRPSRRALALATLGLAGALTLAGCSASDVQDAKAKASSAASSASAKAAQAKAALDEARAKLADVQGKADDAQDKVASLSASAKATAARAIADAKSAAVQAQAALAEAKSNVAGAQDDLQAARAKVDAAKQKVGDARAGAAAAQRRPVVRAVLTRLTRLTRPGPAPTRAALTRTGEFRGGRRGSLYAGRALPILKVWPIVRRTASCGATTPSGGSSARGRRWPCCSPRA